MQAREHSRDRILTAIAVFKFVKAFLLVATGVGALRLLNPTVADHARRWISALAWQIDPDAWPALEARLAWLQSPKLKLLSVAAFSYSMLFAVEGFGLWRAKRWAEYLTIVATCSFIPFEVYELTRRLTWPRVLTLVINLLVVVYLIWRVRRRPD